MSKKVLRPFNPVEEFTAGRYVFNKELGFGKFDKCYAIPVLANSGKLFLLGTFQNAQVEYIDHCCLPDGVFVPTIPQMSDWNDALIGEDWRDKPKEVLKNYGIKFYRNAHLCNPDDTYKSVHLASSSCPWGNRLQTITINRKAAYICMNGDPDRCSFVPIFFNNEFYRKYKSR